MHTHTRSMTIIIFIKTDRAEGRNSPYVNTIDAQLANSVCQQRRYIGLDQVVLLWQREDSFHQNVCRSLLAGTNLLQQFFHLIAIEVVA